MRRKRTSAVPWNRRSFIVNGRAQSSEGQPHPANCVLMLMLMLLRDYEPDGIPGLGSVWGSIRFEDQVRLQVSGVVMS